MNKKLFILLFLLFTIFIFTGCSIPKLQLLGDEGQHITEVWITRPDGEVEYYTGKDDEIRFTIYQGRTTLDIGESKLYVANENVYIKRTDTKSNYWR